VLVKGLEDRLRRTEEHLQLYERKHEDLEAVLAERNTAYEELLGKLDECVVGTQLTILQRDNHPGSWEQRSSPKSRYGPVRVMLYRSDP
jgi:hypothetical protein